MPFSVPVRFEDVDGSICVELSHARGRNLISGFANIFESQEKLGGQVGHGHGGGIMESQALDSSEGDVLGNLNAEALEANDEDIGRAHAPHSLMAQDIELAAVERLVDLGAAYDGLVDLHSSHQVNLGKLLLLQVQSQ